MLIKISRAAFIAATSVCKANNDVRYYLCGILLEKAPLVDGKANGLLIVSTDGHRLVAAHDEGAEYSDNMPDQLIVQFGTESLRACKLVKNLENTVSLEVSDADVFTSIGVSCFEDSKVIDGTFPEWRRVAADREGTAAGWYNAKYIADFEKVARYLSQFRKKGLAALTIRSDDLTSSAVVRFSGNEYAFGMLMPMRQDAELPGLPSWAVGPFPKPKAVKSA